MRAGGRGRRAWTTVLQRTRKLPLSNSRKHPNTLRDWTCHPSTAVRPTHMAGYLPGLATWLAGSSLRPTSSEVAAGCARSGPEVDPKRHISTHLSTHLSTHPWPALLRPTSVTYLSSFQSQSPTETAPADRPNCWGRSRQRRRRKFAFSERKCGCSELFCG